MSTDRLGKYTSSGDEIHYSDIPTNFNIHPETGYLMKNLNAVAVKAAMKNVIMTNQGEVPFQPNKGSNIRKILFEDISEVTTDMLKMHIRDALATETRVHILDLIVIPDEVLQSYNITIVFEIINNTNQQVLNLVLYRVR